jgi:serine protease
MCILIIAFTSPLTRNSRTNRFVPFSYISIITSHTPPHSGVLSTIPRDGGVQGSYAEFSGTSMACPHVAGVAALLISHFPECTNNQIRNAMLRSTSEPPLDSQNTPGWDKYYGWGIVNAGRAYELLKCMGCEGAGGPYPSPGETLSDQARGGMDQLSWTSITNMPDGVCQPEPEPEPSSKSGKGSKSSF